MNKKKKFLPSGLFELIALTASLLVLYSCEKEEEIDVLSNPESKVSIQYQNLNTGDDALYEWSSSHVFRRTSAWLTNLHGGDTAWVRKEIILTSNSENVYEMSVYIGFQRNEAEGNLLELVELGDEELNYWERGWDYKSTTKEIERFYKKEGVLIQIGAKPLSLDYFKIERLQAVMVDGIEKTYVELRFRGKAFGFYDGYKEHHGYCIKEGFFAGVIE